MWVETLMVIYRSGRRKDTEYWKYTNSQKTVNLDLTNHTQFHNMNDYGYRDFNWTHHNFVNDVFNNCIRGAGLISNFNEFDADISLFAHHLKEFTAFLQTEERRVRVIETRVRDSEMGRAKSESAKEEVNTLIQTRLDSAILPTAPMPSVQPQRHSSSSGSWIAFSSINMR